MMPIGLVGVAFGFAPRTEWWHADQQAASGFLAIEAGAVYFAPAFEYGSLVESRSLTSPVVVTLPVSSSGPRHLDLHPAPGLLACEDGPGFGELATIECLTGNVVLLGDRALTASDIDGDGLADILGAYVGVHLQRPGGFTTAPYPTPALADAPYLIISLDDVTGDGRDDLLYSYFTGPVFMGYYYDFRAGHLELHEGGPDGFVEQPTWAIDLDTPVIDAIALQMDGDPEVEILAIGGEQTSEITVLARSTQLVRVDLTEAGPEWVHLQDGGGGDSFGGRPPRLEPFDDVDGDGLREVILTGYVEVAGTGIVPFRVLGSATNWDMSNPLLAFKATTEQAGESGHSYDAEGLAIGDLDGDGRDDIAFARSNELYFGSDNIYPTTVQVWYAPWLEADPVVEHTRDTGAATDTTGPATDPGATDTTPEPPRTCGCLGAPISAPMMFTLLVAAALLRRRTGVSP